MSTPVFKRALLVFVAAAWIVGFSRGPVRAQSGSKPVSSPAPAGAQVDSRAVLNQYCIGCHNTRLKTGGLSLDDIDPALAPARPDVWEKVILKLRTGQMPPAGQRRPDPAILRGVAASLEAAI